MSIVVDSNIACRRKVNRGLVKKFNIEQAEYCGNINREGEREGECLENGVSEDLPSLPQSHLYFCRTWPELQAL